MKRRIVSDMGRPYDGLLAELEKAWGSRNGSLETAEEYLRSIGLIRDSIDKLRVLASEHIRNQADEINFFRNVWPVFFGRLLLFIWLHGILLRRIHVPADDWPAVVKAEEDRAQLFFRRNADFWCYFKSGAAVINEQFTRSFSRNCIFEPMALVIDQDHATLASYRAAKGLAFEEYLAYLKGELRLPAGADSQSENGSPQFEFDGTDAEGQEWLMELFASKVIRKRGGDHANLSELNRWFKANFGREFNKLFDKLNILRNRKIDPLKFFNKRLKATERWMGEKNGVNKR